MRLALSKTTFETIENLARTEGQAHIPEFDEMGVRIRCGRGCERFGDAFQGPSSGSE